MRNWNHDLAILMTISMSLHGCDMLSTKKPQHVNQAGTHVPQTISPEAQAFLKQMNGDIIGNYILDADGNNVLDDRHRAAAPDMHIEEVLINGVKAFWVSTPEASGTDFVIVYFHGGGFVVGDGEEDGGIILPVYEAAGVRGLSVDYRLAPQHPFPAAVEDAVSVYLGLLEKGYRPRQIALSGDSAGGNLAVAAALALKDRGLPLPGALALISPGVIDMKVFGDTWSTLWHWDPFCMNDDLYANIDKYGGDHRRDDPLMSPIYGDLVGLPPMLIQVGTRELLLSDAVRLARKAREAGVDVTLDVWEGMWHSWHMTWPDVPEARQACEEMAQFIKKHLPVEGK